MSRSMAETFETTVELEQDLLAVLYLSHEDVRCAEAYSALTPEDFHDSMHRKAWVVLQALHERGEPPILGSLLAEAEGHDWSSSEACRLFYDILDVRSPVACTIPWLCRHIRERRRRREIVGLGEEIAQIGAGTSSAEVSADVQRRLASLADLETADHPRTAREWIIARGFDAARGVPVVWPKLADLLRCWWDGWLYVIGGRPSQGKTALCVNVALRAAQAGVRVCIESLEMSGDMLIDRSTAILSGLSVSRLLESGLRDYEIAAIGAAHQALADMPLTIHAGASHRLDQILARLRAWRMTVAGDGPALVVVDYVGLIDAGKSRAVDQVSAVSRALKCLAGQLACPILACSQLNRGVEMREDLKPRRKSKDASADDPERPRLSDLRDSGSLEQDADAVLMLYGLERGKSGTCNVSVEKQRQGPTGDCQLRFNAGLTRFEEVPSVLVSA